ncbi:MAG: hypothetical protein PHS59_17910 [Paludibacter sp.]|nr:hypothetical protein [Paludibacter sp.]
MEKITFFVALLFISLISLQAQNLLVNGDFENKDFATFGYESILGCPDLVAGWDSIAPFTEGTFNNTGLYIYNVRATMRLDTVPNSQYIRIARYEWDGNTDGGLTQTVDVLPNTTYTLSFLYRLSTHAESSTLVPAWCKIQEDDNTPSKSSLYNTNYDNMDYKWYPKTKTYKTSATAKQIRVMLGVTGGKIYSWGGNIDMWADFDNVSLVAAEPSAINELAANRSQIKAYAIDSELSLSDLDAREEVSIYNALGKLVTTFYPTSESAKLSLTGKGLYIIKNGLYRVPLKLIIK